MHEKIDLTLLVDHPKFGDFKSTLQEIISDPIRSSNLKQRFDILQFHGATLEEHWELYQDIIGSSIDAFDIGSCIGIVTKSGGSLNKHLSLYRGVLKKYYYQEEITQGFRFLNKFGATLEDNFSLYTKVVSQPGYAADMGCGFLALQTMGLTLQSEPEVFEDITLEISLTRDKAKAITLLRQQGADFRIHRELYDSILKRDIIFKDVLMILEALQMSGATLKDQAGLYLDMLDSSYLAEDFSKAFASLTRAGGAIPTYTDLYEKAVANTHYSKHLAANIDALTQIGANLSTHAALYDALLKSNMDLSASITLMAAAGATLSQHQPFFEKIISSSTTNIAPCIKTFLKMGITFDAHEDLYKRLMVNKFYAQALNQGLECFHECGFSLKENADLFEMILERAPFADRIGRCLSILKKIGIDNAHYPELFNLFLENIDDSAEIETCLELLSQFDIQPAIHANYLQSAFHLSEATALILKSLAELGLNPSSNPQIYNIFLTGSSNLSVSRYHFAKIVLKMDKHLKTTGIEAFQALSSSSQEEVFKEFISEVVSVDSCLTEGPLQKSTETKEIERILQKIATLDIDSIDFYYDENLGYVLTLPDEEPIYINLLLLQVNFSHIQLTYSEVEQLGEKINNATGDFNGAPLQSSNFIADQLPQAAQRALTCYVGDVRYKNINRIFRGVPLTSEEKYTWIKPIMGTKSLLANFLCSSIINWSAAELSRLFSDAPQRKLIEKVFHADTFKEELAACIANGALYLGKLNTCVNEDKITPEEYAILIDLHKILSMLYPQYGLVDRRENLRKLESEGELGIYARRLANPIHTPTVTSLSIFREGSSYFQNADERTSFETDFNQYPLLNAAEGEILAPQGIEVIYTANPKGGFFAKVVASPSIQPQEDYLPWQALAHSFKHYLSKSYPEEEPFILNNVEIYRRNHGLAHTYRVMTYIPIIISYFALHAEEEAFKTFCQEITDEEICWLKVAAAFSVTGRTSEVAAKEDWDSYDKMRETCSEHFKTFLSQKLFSNLDPALQADLENIVRHLGNPNFEKGQEGNPAINQLPNENQRMYRNFLHRILNIAHKLDLARCYGVEKYSSVMSSCLELSKQNPEQDIDYWTMVRYVNDLLKAHGNAVHTEVTSEDTFSDCNLSYRLPFEKVSTNLRQLKEMTDTISKPKFKTSNLRPAVI